MIQNSLIQASSLRRPLDQLCIFSRPFGPGLLLLPPPPLLLLRRRRRLVLLRLLLRLQLWLLRLLLL